MGKDKIYFIKGVNEANVTAVENFKVRTRPRNYVVHYALTALEDGTPIEQERAFLNNGDAKKFINVVKANNGKLLSLVIVEKAE